MLLDDAAHGLDEDRNVPGLSLANAAAVSERRSCRYEEFAQHHARAGAAMEAIAQVMDSGHPLALAFSSGKDSSAVVGMALLVARGRVENGFAVPANLLQVRKDAAAARAAAEAGNPQASDPQGLQAERDRSVERPHG